METLVIYYDDNTNSFEDDYGNTEDSVVDIMTYDDMIHYKKEGGTYYREMDGTKYEIVFPFRDQERRLQYDSETNIIYDEGGSIVFNIFSIIDPNTLYLFKSGKEDMMVSTVSGGTASLMWIDSCELFHRELMGFSGNSYER